jgi:hypothetical protein
MAVTACRFARYSLSLYMLQPAALNVTAWRYEFYSLPL